MRTVDQAWQLIVNARGSVQGKVFRMSEGTLLRIARERNIALFPLPVKLYSVRIEIVSDMPLGTITLEKR